MDRAFINFLSIGPLTVIAILIVTITGAILASRLINVDFKFRRVTYFWYGQLLFLVFGVLQIGTVFVASAITYGIFVLFCVLMASTYLLFGAGIYIGSAARSNHISDEPKFAWLAFIPVANLWLLFKPGNKDNYRYWYEHGIRDGFILAVALIPGAIASEILSELGEGSWKRVAVHTFETNAQLVDEKAYYMALSFKRGYRSPCPT
ncbi:MAG: hypothetical protein AB8B94_09110, partial [Hyphomicrobiales bacterium]